MLVQRSPLKSATPTHSESVTSAATSPVTNVSHSPTGGATITGVAAEGEVLTADTSTLADADGLGALSYQWSQPNRRSHLYYPYADTRRCWCGDHR